MLAIQSINGVALAVQPTRDGYQAVRSDLLGGSSGRSAETGTAIRYPVRLGVYKLTLKFKGTLTEIQQVDTLVSRFSQTVVFLYCGTYVTATMYPSDRTLTSNGFTAELSVNLIEV